MDFINEIGLLLYDSAVGTIIDVMTWVVLSILFFEILNILTKNRFYNAIEDSKYAQPFYGAALGSIPGCSGPIIVTSLYNKRKVSLGTLAATFIATFGDAAFVILAFDPYIFLWLMIISFIVGVTFGYIIDLTPIGRKLQSWIDNEPEKVTYEELISVGKTRKSPSRFWIDIDTIFLPSLFLLLILMVFPATLINIIWPTWTDEATGLIESYMLFAEIVSLFLVFFFMGYYFLRRFLFDEHNEDYRTTAKHDHSNIDYCAGCGINNYETEVKNKGDKKNKIDYGKLQYETFINSIFILTWVFIGLFTFEFLFQYFEDELVAVFSAMGGYMAVLIAIGIGMIPGCGPQIAFANFYLYGLSYPGGQLIPDSAMAANSINQDGDAEFPLMATEGRAFITMWWLNVIPALITGTVMFGLETINPSIIPY